MRNGNSLEGNGRYEECEFLSYLWGMETKHIQKKTKPYNYRVLILPMRNGNYQRKTLKSWSTKMVLILPMRNGNKCILFYRYPSLTFLSYLWGMETLYPVKPARSKRYWVLILPMRNGNIRMKFFWKLIIQVLILPMRNGNISSFNSLV